MKNTLVGRLQRRLKPETHIATLDVLVVNEQEEFIIEEERYKALCEQVLNSVPLAGVLEFSLLFVDENEMAKLNELHMGYEGPTDVLAFPIDEQLVTEPEGAGFWNRLKLRSQSNFSDQKFLLGDVVICPSVANRNAAENAESYSGHTGNLRSEIDLLVVHGVLHVLGMDHANSTEEKEMQAAERVQLKSFSHRPAA
ncbi:MAG: rRNA maturation RNase YbeY [Actinomycetota bacterium]|nr:rRNA maturation RNase YbeY [Acidimicrobiales bacterium]